MQNHRRVVYYETIRYNTASVRFSEEEERVATLSSGRRRRRCIIYRNIALAVLDWKNGNMVAGKYRRN